MATCLRLMSSRKNITLIEMCLAWPSMVLLAMPMAAVASTFMVIAISLPNSSSHRLPRWIAVAAADAIARNSASPLLNAT